MARGLESLPTELLTKIIAEYDDFPAIRYVDEDEIIPPSRIAWLRYISHVSRTFHLAIEPFLYREFQSRSSSAPVRPFLRTLCEKPYLARQVQNVTVGAIYRAPSEPNDFEKALFQTAMEAFRDYEWYECVLDAILRGCHIAEAILLLAVATNLRQLTVYFQDPMNREGQNCKMCQGCPDMATCFTSLISRAAQRCSGAYRRLHRVEVIHGRTNPTTSRMMSIQPALASELMQLPALATTLQWQK